MSRKFVSPHHMHANPFNPYIRHLQATILRVTQRSPIIAYVNMYANRFYRHTTFPYCRHRQATNYVQRHTTFPYYCSCEHVCKPLLSSHNVSLFSTSTGNQLCSASHNFPLSSLMWTCMQTAFIVTQRLPIVDIDRQPTIFSATQRFPIIAHVNMHANSIFRYTTTSYHRSRQHEALNSQASN